MAVLMIMHHYDDPDEDHYLAVLDERGITPLPATQFFTLAEAEELVARYQPFVTGRHKEG